MGHMSIRDLEEERVGLLEDCKKRPRKDKPHILLSFLALRIREAGTNLDILLQLTGYRPIPCSGMAESNEDHKLELPGHWQPPGS